MGTPTLRYTDWQRAYPANVTSSAAYDAMARTLTKPADALDRAGFRSGAVMFVLTDAANEVGTAQIVAVKRVVPGPEIAGPAPTQAPLYVEHLYGTLTGITASTLTGVDGSPVPATERFADLATWALSPYGTFLEQAYGKVARLFQHSTENLEPAELMLPDLGDNWAWAIRMRVSTAASINALVRNGM